MPTPTHLTDLTIAEAAVQLERREISSAELTEAYLARIERLNPAINAYVTVTADRARADAKAADAESRSRQLPGSAARRTIGLKDLYDTAGIETAGGSRDPQGRVPAKDSTAARKLAEAGAVLSARQTRTSSPGARRPTTPTPGRRTTLEARPHPRRSSGGSGAAIAARMAAGTLGTDTGGSIRIPAALCGAVGLKPTSGRASKAGVLPMSWQFDHPGPICRTVEDAAIMMRAIAGYDPDDFATVPVPVPDYREGLEGGVMGLRIGVPREQFFGLLDPEVRVAVEEAIALLATLGAEVVDIDPGFTREQTNRAWPLVNAEGQVHHRPYFGEHPEAYSEDLAGLRTLPLPDALGLTEAYRASYDVKEGLRRTFEVLDLLVTPTTLQAASLIGNEEVDVEGRKLSPGAPSPGTPCPSISGECRRSRCPAGSRARLPIGLQLAAGPFQEALVLRAARAYEAATDWHTRSADC